MLKLNPRQMGSLDNGQEQLFRNGLVQQLRQQHENCAALHPLIVYRLVGPALARARGYGIKRQKALSTFVSLMAGTAANFDAHPAVHALLVAPGTAAESRPGSLVERLPAGVWAEVAERTSTIGWFLSEDMFDVPAPRRIALALPNALPASVASHANALEPRVVAAIERARPIGFHLEDHQFVYAACEVLYDEDFAAAQPWAAQALNAAHATATRAGLLRARIAIDTGAWL